MELNWKRGLTRLYIVLWGFWLLFVAVRMAATTPMLLGGSVPSSSIAAFVAFGFVLPGLLLIGLRWAGNGFSR